MTPTQIIRPETLEEAVEALQGLGSKAQVIAGATDVVTQLRRGAARPSCWIDLSLVKGEAREIRQEGDRVLLGAMVTFQAIASSELVRRTLPALHDAANLMGSIQIRSRGTLGGNVGNASPAGDSIGPLIVGDARACVLSAAGKREVPVEAMFAGPGRLRIDPHEVIASFSYPVQPEAWSGYLRLGTRAVHEIAKVSAALRASFVDGTLRGVRVALGAVAPTPLRARGVEAVLEGQGLSPDIIDRAADAACREGRPIDDVRSTAEYRTGMCGELLRELLERFQERFRPFRARARG